MQALSEEQAVVLGGKKAGDTGQRIPNCVESPVTIRVNQMAKGVDAVSGSLGVTAKVGVKMGCKAGQWGRVVLQKGTGAAEGKRETGRGGRAGETRRSCIVSVESEGSLQGGGEEPVKAELKGPRGRRHTGREGTQG